MAAISIPFFERFCSAFDHWRYPSSPCRSLLTVKNGEKDDVAPISPTSTPEIFEEIAAGGPLPVLHGARMPAGR
ncbi:hypothetical protein RB623_25385 [Mesorhizobium sp. LHD-90]|uniref:hypothetical protein n=1 Tax=Mesorhizobium sp. LHD-90 TaxID=3071414 RepID=UPI0027E1EC99|nr:hypothetical protein [Mesorhizobium sp. LHD-90]MDQ6437400.1 hypothetical protein [Mesorhizobium sp. LHD-90]